MKKYTNDVRNYHESIKQSKEEKLANEKQWKLVIISKMKENEKSWKYRKYMTSLGNNERNMKTINRMQL